MSSEEVSKMYPDPVDFMGVHTIRFWACSSQFEIPYIYIAMQLIDAIDKGKITYPLRDSDSKGAAAAPKSAVPSSAFTLSSPVLSVLASSPYYQLFEDLHETINYNFGSFEEGSYFEPFRNGDVSRFLFDRRNLIPWLESLRQSGIRVFLMTNSNHHYTKCLMDCAFGDDWKRLFDLIIYRARKPHFFFSESHFSSITDLKIPGEVNGLKAMGENDKIQLGGEYYGGNVKKMSEDLLGPNSTVIYVGDELFGDVVAPSVYSDWKTIAIVEELQEVEQENGYKSPSEPNGPKLDDTAAFVALERWGNFFYCEDGKTLTFYGSLMHHFAEIAIPCVSRLAHFPLDLFILPLHPSSQINSTKPIDQKVKASVHITESTWTDLPENFIVPGPDSVAQTIQLNKDLKLLRESMIAEKR